MFVLILGLVVGNRGRGAVGVRECVDFDRIGLTPEFMASSECHGEYSSDALPSSEHGCLSVSAA